MNMKEYWEGGNFLTYSKKYGIKKSVAKLKYSFIMLETPEQILMIEMIAFSGMIVGVIFAIVFLIYFGMWYLTGAAAFSILLQYAGLKNKWQQYQQLKDIQNLYTDKEEVSKDE